MRRFFELPDRWNLQLETVILGLVDTINFHFSNHEVIEDVASHFKNGDMVLRFTPDFLDTVYNKLISPAREFGYYYGDLPKSERPGVILSSSACQQGGDDRKFSAACVSILSAIDEERARREQLKTSVLPH